MDMDCFHRINSAMTDWPGPKLKVLKLSLYGEPFMNPLFCDMLKIARDADIAERIETTTNASFLNRDICRKLIENGLDYMRVSIYSPIQIKHREITRSSIELAAIHDNLLLLKQIKGLYGSAAPFVSVKMLDTYGPENDLLFDTFQDVADEIYIDKPHNWISTKGSNFIDDLYGSSSDKARRDIQRNSSPRIACTLPFFTLAVRSNGDVSPCCNDWMGGTNIGSIFHETIQDIWHGDRMFDFRKMQLENRKGENESCGNCQFYLSDYYIRDNVDGFAVDRLKIDKD
jgi:radical SAM protein with 4Fe4S-binding SPASM domain